MILKIYNLIDPPWHRLITRMRLHTHHYHPPTTHTNFSTGRKFTRGLLFGMLPLFTNHKCKITNVLQMNGHHSQGAHQPILIFFRCVFISRIYSVTHSVSHRSRWKYGHNLFLYQFLSLCLCHCLSVAVSFSLSLSLQGSQGSLSLCLCRI